MLGEFAVPVAYTQKIISHGRICWANEKPPNWAPRVIWPYAKVMDINLPDQIQRVGIFDIVLLARVFITCGTRFWRSTLYLR